MHRWPSGRRCRQASEHGNSSFCATHAAVEQNRHRGDRLYDLLQSDNNLLTAREINKSLASLYMLLAEDKISARRAAVLAYISSLLLRTLPAVEKEESPDGTQIILDLPRPQSGAEPAPDAHPVAAAVRDVIPPALRHSAEGSETRDLLFSSSAAPDTHLTAAADTTPAAVVAGLQTRSFAADVVTPPALLALRGEGRNEGSLPVAGGRSSLPASGGRDLLFSPSLTPTTPPPPNPPSKQSSTVYRDPNYDDHWFPTANVIKTAAELERQRFAPNPKSPHQEPNQDARKPAA